MIEFGLRGRIEIADQRASIYYATLFDHRNGTAAKRHLLAIPTQQRSVSFLGVAAKRHLRAIPTKRRSVSFLGVAFFFVICFSYEAQRIRPNLDLSK